MKEIKNPSDIYSDYIKTLPKQVGEKVTFQGTKKFWFTNIVKDAGENLVVGQKYTIKDIRPASSWTAVELEEFPGKTYSYHWFK